MLAKRLILFAGFISILNFSVNAAVVVEPKIIDLGYGYILGQEAVPHPTAKSLCDFAGKELVSIETLEEDVLILSLLRAANFSFNIWTSGTNTHQESDKRAYRWGNGAPLFYTRWLLGFPRGDSIYCLSLTVDYADRAWATVNCTTNYYPLCENKKEK